MIECVSRPRFPLQSFRRALDGFVLRADRLIVELWKILVPDIECVDIDRFICRLAYLYKRVCELVGTRRFCSRGGLNMEDVYGVCLSISDLFVGFSPLSLVEVDRAAA